LGWRPLFFGLIQICKNRNLQKEANQPHHAKHTWFSYHNQLRDNHQMAAKASKLFTSNAGTINLKRKYVCQIGKESIFKYWSQLLR
jgi:hypothetical protein